MKAHLLPALALLMAMWACCTEKPPSPAPSKSIPVLSLYIESWERISFTSPPIYSKMHSKLEAETVLATHRRQMSSVEVMLAQNLQIGDKEKSFESEIDEIQEWLVSQGMTNIVFRLAMGKSDPRVIRVYTNGRIVRPTLDGKLVTLEGLWNALLKEGCKIICDTEPRIVNVINIGDLSKPVHNRRIRVVSILHWREMTPEQKKLIWEQRDVAPQGVPDGYFIHWPEAKWEYIDQ